MTNDQRDRWWAMDFERGVEFFTTEAEAKALAMAREQSWDGGWPDMACICWGSVHGAVMQTEYKSLEELDAEGDERMAETLRSNGWDYFAEFKLLDFGRK